MSVPSRSCPSTVLLLLGACGGSGDFAPGPGPPNVGEIPEIVEIGHPFPKKGSRFGEHVKVTDLDADGDLDLVIAAPGQGLIYLAERSGPDDDPSWEIISALGADGQVHLPFDDKMGGEFGFSFAVGEVDGDPEPELIVGAPGRKNNKGEAFLFGVGGSLYDLPRKLIAPAPGLFGSSVAFGDFDGDEEVDLVISATRADVDGLAAGRLFLYAGPLTGSPTVALDLPNPAPVDDGSFGLHLVVDQPVGAGFLPTLTVAAPGNDSSLGVPAAGQVYRFPGPLDPAVHQLAEDPTGDEVDPPRFGMHIAARDGFLAVGAPRKDVGASFDTGQGFVFDPDLARATLHNQEVPEQLDLLGFRVGVGNVIGDGDLDFLFLTLQQTSVLIWDGDEREALPFVLEALPGSGDHVGMGLAIADLLGDGREEVVLGDPTWDREGMGINDNPGRVVIHRIE